MDKHTTSAEYSTVEAHENASHYMDEEGGLTIPDSEKDRLAVGKYVFDKVYEIPDRYRNALLIVALNCATEIVQKGQPAHIKIATAYKTLKSVMSAYSHGTELLSIVQRSWFTVLVEYLVYCRLKQMDKEIKPDTYDSHEGIHWEVCSIHDLVDNNMYDCNMIGHDEEGNTYNGWAVVYDPYSMDGQWDTVTDIEQER